VRAHAVAHLPPFILYDGDAHLLRDLDHVRSDRADHARALEVRHVVDLSLRVGEHRRRLFRLGVDELVDPGPRPRRLRRVARDEQLLPGIDDATLLGGQLRRRRLRRQSSGGQRARERDTDPSRTTAPRAPLV
jgi:hypothetical protein